VTSPRLVERLQIAFADWTRPSIIYRYTSASPDRRYTEREFRGLERGQLTADEAGRLLVDSSNLTDSAILYLLPDLVKEGLTGINSFMLVHRLQDLDRSGLNPIQNALLDDTIDDLEDAEIEFELREEAEWNEEREDAPE